MSFIGSLFKSVAPNLIGAIAKPAFNWIKDKNIPVISTLAKWGVDAADALAKGSGFEGAANTFIDRGMDLAQNKMNEYGIEGVDLPDIKAGIKGKRKGKALDDYFRNRKKLKQDTEEMQIDKMDYEA